MKWWLVFAGGGIGAVLRVALGLWVERRLPAAFPWGTFAVNVSGCLAIGAIATLADEARLLTPQLRLFAIAGVLGGFTTFSTYGLETARLAAEQGVGLAALYAAASVAAGLAAVFSGTLLVRALI